MAHLRNFVAQSGGFGNIDFHAYFVHICGDRLRKKVEADQWVSDFACADYPESTLMEHSDRFARP